MKRIIAILLLAGVLDACMPGNVARTGEPAPIYPDYTDIVVPENIAPLNFMLRESVSRVLVCVDDRIIASSHGSSIRFSPSRWRSLMDGNVGGSIGVRVLAKNKDGWKEYNTFSWSVSGDRVDPYLTYRLIEPDYEAYNNIVLQQRCVENFSTDDFSDFNVIGNKCMNCHTYAGQDPDNTMFYVRGQGGGAFLNRSGSLTKLAIRGEDMVSGSVYFGFSPSKRYICFSSNKIIPAYHSQPRRRMEVFDTRSDVYVADLENRSIIRSPLLEDSGVMETFPTFSPDGAYIYYCAAPQLDTITLDLLENVHYSLCRIGFDEASGTIGTQVDTIYSASSEGGSVCHPRISPDGRFLCFSVADYGTFPLWHSESDLMLMDLRSGSIVPMDQANSDQSDTYHSWSSNSRWIVFASKRGDGVYGKPYFTHVDTDGNCSKAFVLPQKHPGYYDNLLTSFNAPEMGRGPLPFSTYDVYDAMKQEAVTFK